MGKISPKPQFIDVSCPNKDCNFYGLTYQGNVTGNGTYISRGKKQEDIFASTAAKYSMTIQALFIIIFAKMSKLLI